MSDHEEPRPQISILDARLAEIDRRLETIQTGLVDDEGRADDQPPGAPGGHSASVVELPPRVQVPEPEVETGSGLDAPAAGAPGPAPAAPSDLSAGPAHPGGQAGTLLSDLRSLAAAHERALSSLREVLVAYERALAQAPPPELGTRPAPARGLALTAGPFSSTEAVRRFELALRTVPGVEAVELRGYQGGDRVVMDVQLTTTP